VTTNESPPPSHRRNGGPRILALQQAARQAGIEQTEQLLGEPYLI